jgi:hypothetical protein
MRSSLEKKIDEKMPYGLLHFREAYIFSRMRITAFMEMNTSGMSAFTLAWKLDYE